MAYGEIPLDCIACRQASKRLVNDGSPVMTCRLAGETQTISMLADCLCYYDFRRMAEWRRKENALLKCGRTFEAAT